MLHLVDFFYVYHVTLVANHIAVKSGQRKAAKEKNVFSFAVTLAKRWKVQFRLGFATTTKKLNNIDSNNGIQI